MLEETPDDGATVAVAEGGFGRKSPFPHAFAEENGGRRNSRLCFDALCM